MSSLSDLLADVPLLAEAAPELRERLASSAYPKKLSRGQVLFVEGEPCDAIYVVKSGRLKISVTSPHGDELVLSVLRPGESVGELGIVDGGTRSAGALALEDTELVCLPRDAVMTLLHASPEASLALAQELAATLRRLTSSAADLVFLDLPRRLAKLLVTGDVDGIAQAQVAARLGVGRQSLNKALSRFADRGWVEVQRAAVVVRDRAALQKFADS
ncbi:MAG: Crp/Fnr family transcriptional regulator [Frankiaceae bacterium]|nr:Crp/Fnr family transcriptional regulator [Frankiaceae bacterium]